MLQQGLTESLAGRFEATYMGHWSYGEMHDAFGLTAEEFIWFGGYPGAISLKMDEDRWKGYIRDSLLETSISKDILMLTRVDKPALMKRLFELGSVYSGQVLSYTKIMGQLADAGNTTTLANYLELLNDAGLLGGLEKYSPNMVRKRSSSPKFMVHNTAIMSGISTETFQTLVADPKVWGRWVESAVGAHLINQSFKDKKLSLYYWREGNEEVDFVVE
jgi:predicted AAA+ superfamily ATPase